MALEGGSEDSTIYKVLVDHEKQYSIWPDNKKTRHGWDDEGTRGTKAECFARVEALWDEMRPMSLRERMEEEKRRAEQQRPRTDGGLRRRT